MLNPEKPPLSDFLHPLGQETMNQAKKNWNKE
jgi:hypothetical protein